MEFSNALKTKGNAQGCQAIKKYSSSSYDERIKWSQTKVSGMSSKTKGEMCGIAATTMGEIMDANDVIKHCIGNKLNSLLQFMGLMGLNERSNSDVKHLMPSVQHASVVVIVHKAFECGNEFIGGISFITLLLHMKRKVFDNLLVVDTITAVLSILHEVEKRDENGNGNEKEHKSSHHIMQHK
ncbi:CLUMA_CG018713, isoform A [Clunio marinus]|uniref:CLUMA_CG018713, isoform A n=1 Tax=Clunio marinus TaxID=568069 RepID=A0A1J1J488_9DIPT|nr:CLUMA_CG018713, isoform A [Clunio marinus]